MQLVVIVRTFACLLEAPGLGHKKNNLPGPIPTTSRCCSFLMEFLWITYGQFIFALGPSQNNLLPILVFENSNTLLISTQLFDAIQ